MRTLEMKRTTPGGTVYRITANDVPKDKYTATIILEGGDLLPRIKEDLCFDLGAVVEDLCEQCGIDVREVYE